MEEDEDGFYSRLGFANIDESVLAVEYKFAYYSSIKGRLYGRGEFTDAVLEM